MTTTIGYSVLQSFTAGGVEYTLGNMIALDVAQAWPDGALVRRLEHKFLIAAAMPTILDALPAESPKPVVVPVRPNVKPSSHVSF